MEPKVEVGHEQDTVSKGGRGSRRKGERGTSLEMWPVHMTAHSHTWGSLSYTATGKLDLVEGAKPAGRSMRGYYKQFWTHNRDCIDIY